MSIVRERRSVKMQPVRQYDIVGLPTRYFNPGELEILLYLFESVSAKTVVEFGVNNGRNAAAAFRNVATLRKYVGVDVTPDYVTGMECQRKEIPVIPGELALGFEGFELIVKPRGTFELKAGDLPKADAVFIDADHSRAGVMNDYALARDIIKPGGVIIFHDDNCLPVVEVTQTINDLGIRATHVEGTWLTFERIEK